MIKLTKSDSFKVRPMTRNEAFGLRLDNKLPSGSGLVISSDEYKVDIFLAGYYDSSIEMVMFWTDEDGEVLVWSKSFEGWDTHSESEVKGLVRSILRSLTNESLSAHEVADKYDLSAT